MYTKKDVVKIKKYMIRQGETLAVAESVTAGHIQAALSLADEASNFFQGGITAYTLGQKSRHLQIDPIAAFTCNSVSERIARDMAVNVCVLFCSDWGIGITGYAAPLPELNIHSLFAYFAISHRGKISHAEKIECRKKSVKDVQEFYAVTVLNNFDRYLSTVKG